MIAIILHSNDELRFGGPARPRRPARARGGAAGPRAGGGRGAVVRHRYCNDSNNDNDNNDINDNDNDSKPNTIIIIIIIIIMMMIIIHIISIIASMIGGSIAKYHYYHHYDCLIIQARSYAVALWSSLHPSDMQRMPRPQRLAALRDRGGQRLLGCSGMWCYSIRGCGV